MKLLAAFTCAAVIALPQVAVAQESTVTGAAGGAVTGAVVGGSVGAAIGGVTGAIAGTVLDPPPAEVRTYVSTEVPTTTSVRIDGDLAIGQPLPDTVQIVPIPQHETYAYAVVNERRVIVDPATRVVVQVVD